MESTTNPTPSKTMRIPWHRRLQGHVLLGILAIAVLTLTLILLASRQIVTDFSLNRSRDDMKAARDAFYLLIRQRTDFAEREARLITELPVFRSYITDSRLAKDVANVSGMAANYRNDLNADFCIVTDAKGGWMGWAGWDGPHRAAGTLAAGIGNALQNEPFHGLMVDKDRLYLIVVEPARFGEDEVLGTFTTGYRLDDGVARSLAQVARCEVNFLSGSTIFGSSLSSDWKQRIGSSMFSLTAALRPDRPVLWDFGSADYVSGIYPLSRDRSSGQQLLLMQDWSPTRRFLHQIVMDLVWIGFGVFLLALAGGWAFSLRVTQPLQNVVSAAEVVAQGNWDHPAPVEGNVEVRQLAEAFNRMTSNLNHYYRDARDKSEQLEDALLRLESSYSDTLSALSRALDVRDNETEGHSLRVTRYALGIAREMELDEPRMKKLHLGALMHDIGKIGVPDAILRKPGKLNDEEWHVMRRHCEFGLEIVKGIPYLEGAADVIRCHHEHYSGAGYPRRLSGEQIPLEARIFAAADTLDAMTSDRPYRKGCSFEAAMDEIRRCCGTQFDPLVVDALESYLLKMNVLQERAAALVARGERA